MAAGEPRSYKCQRGDHDCCQELHDGRIVRLEEKTQEQDKWLKRLYDQGKQTDRLLRGSTEDANQPGLVGMVRETMVMVKGVSDRLPERKRWKLPIAISTVVTGGLAALAFLWEWFSKNTGSR